MLGPDALSAENAEMTLSNLDRMAAMPTKPTAQNSHQNDSSHDSGLSSLSKIMEDTKRMQHRPAASTYQSVQEAAKGVLFDLDDSSNVQSTSGLRPALPLPTPEYSIGDSPEGGRLLTITVQLPMIESASEANVDVSGSRRLKIHVPGKCSLDLTLPCLVDEDSIKAKWNRSRRDLTISLNKK